MSPKRNYGEDDPLDAFVRKLFNEGTDESVKMAKNLMARQRFFSPVIVRGEEEKGVRLWGYGKMAYKELISLALNPDYGDITDPENGTDLVIKYGKPAGASFPQTQITPRRRSSHLSEDSTQSDEWVNGVPDSIRHSLSPERLQRKSVRCLTSGFHLKTQVAKMSSATVRPQNLLWTRSWTNY